jgi:hypothetical protein
MLLRGWKGNVLPWSLANKGYMTCFKASFLWDTLEFLMISGTMPGQPIGSRLEGAASLKFAALAR